MRYKRDIRTVLKVFALENQRMSNSSVSSIHDEPFAVILTLLSVLVLAIGAAGNVLVLIAIYFVKRLHTTSNAFIANLSVSDFGALIAGVTTIILGLFKESSMIGQDRWVCPVLLHITFIFVFTSITTLQCIAVDRYMIITKPRQIYRKYFTRQGTALILVGTWVVGASISIMALTVGGEALYVEEIHACYINNENPKAWWSLTTAFLVACVPCMIVIPYFFALTFLKIRKTRRRVEGSSSQGRSSNAGLSKEEVAVTRMMLVVYLTFTVCWLPMLLIHFTHYDTHPLYQLHYISCLLALINSAVNPMVYAGMNRFLRHSFSKVLKCAPAHSRENTSISLNYTANQHF